MKHKRFEENILVDEAYTNYSRVDKNEDHKKSRGIATNFAESLNYDERRKWYHQVPEEPEPTNKLTSEQIEALRKEASSALHGDTLAYETKSNRNGSSDQQWARTLLHKGAIGDRVAAATVLIQENPLYNLSALRNLINSVKPAKKKDSIVTIDTLSDLLMADLLIPDVKLRTFEQRPLGHIDELSSGNKHTRKNILKLWYYEDQLKELYGTYVEALNKFAHDSVEANKEKAVSSMSYLLMRHPEREKMLLSNIINKLGDPSQSVASKVIYHLCQLLFNHPNMKGVVLAEIEKMLFRSNISPRAQYYGICFLNQFFLGKDDHKIAESLIKIYFSFFKASIKKGEIDSRLMSAILTGVKRAYPFADKDRLSETPQHIDAIHRLVHLSKFNIAVHALALLFQISDASKGTSDRYYTALYRKLTNADIFNTTHSALLFSLIYKSLKQDKDVSRVVSFIKRLLQLCCYMTPAQTCGMLFLISQVLKDSDKKEAVKLVWTEKIMKELPNAETEIDNDDDAPPPTEEIKEEIKDVKRMDLLKGNKQDLLNDDDECYVDLKIDEEGNVKPKKKKKTITTSSWFHANIKTEEQECIKTETEDNKTKDKQLVAKIQLKKTINMEKVINSYDPNARNPIFSGADCSAFVELLPLSKHFHPSVKVFAEKIINGQMIHYSGDPLIDFSAVRFLDRFVFKNPKKRADQTDNDGDVKKVRGSHPKFALRKNYSAKGLRSLPVNSASYLNEGSEKIPVDERFLYDFLQKRRTAKQDDEDSDTDSVTSEDFNKYLDSVTGHAKDFDEEFDYMTELETMKNTKKLKETNDELEDDGDDSSDGELIMSGDEDEPSGLSGDEDELRLKDSDDDIIENPVTKKSKLNLKLKGKDSLKSLFASAEEFSTLLEETAGHKKQGSSHAVSNTDNSSQKQLAWEDKRDRWIQGYKGGKKKFNKIASKHKMADSRNKMADTKGGKRRKDNKYGGKKRKLK